MGTDTEPRAPRSPGDSAPADDAPQPSSQKTERQPERAPGGTKQGVCAEFSGDGEAIAEESHSTQALHAASNAPAVSADAPEAIGGDQGQVSARLSATEA